MLRNQPVYRKDTRKGKVPRAFRQKIGNMEVWLIPGDVLKPPTFVVIAQFTHSVLFTRLYDDHESHALSLPAIGIAEATA